MSDKEYFTEFFCISPGAIACTVGSYCPTGSTAQKKCSSGYYCPTTTTQILCSSIGSFCPSGSISQNMCPSGYYCPDTSSNILCFPNSYCPVGSTSQTQCKNGYYCPTSSVQTLCQKGYYCPTGSISPVECPAGYSCPNPTTQFFCPSGFYCPAGQKLWTLKNNLNIYQDPNTGSFTATGSSGYGIAGALSSVEGYSTSCYVLFKTSTPNEDFCVGLSKINTGTSYQTINYAFYISGKSSTVQIYESGIAIPTFGTIPAATDTYLIQYTGYFVRYYQNNILLRSVLAGSNVKLYLGNAFNSGLSTAIITNLLFSSGSSNLSTNQLWTPINLLNINQDNYTSGTFTATGVAGWNTAGALSSVEGYSNGCYVSFKTSTPTKDFIVGLSSKNTGTNYNDINFGILINGGAIPPVIELYESGISQGRGVGSAPSASNVYIIQHDGSKVRYYQNNTLLRTVAYSGTLYLGNSFYSGLGEAIITNLVFSNGSTLISTQQLCSTGYYCPPGSITQTLCPEGYYCSNTSTIKLCEIGYYCPPGSTTQPNNNTLYRITKGGNSIAFLNPPFIYSQLDTPDQKCNLMYVSTTADGYNQYRIRSQTNYLYSTGTVLATRTRYPSTLETDSLFTFTPVTNGFRIIDSYSKYLYFDSTLASLAIVLTDLESLATSWVIKLS